MSNGTIAMVRRRALRTQHRRRNRVRNFIALLETWRQRSRGRQELAMMRDDELRDIGIGRYEALFEARKPFWRA
jgi:uncharacterized protein YjiS (DUF1127 family)